MFEFGFGELVLVFMIGLLVLGPQRLPKVAAEIGKWVGRARRTATQLRRQLEREIELADLEEQQKAAPPLNPPLTQAAPPAADSEPSSAPGVDTAASAPSPAAPATPREVSDAISAHSTSPERAASPAPQPLESIDKPPAS
jgi:sec-independent protein translocase protein TatB